jgi:hypothetical protein
LIRRLLLGLVRSIKQGQRPTSTVLFAERHRSKGGGALGITITSGTNNILSQGELEMGRAKSDIHICQPHDTRDVLETILVLVHLNGKFLNPSAGNVRVTTLDLSVCHDNC